MQIAKWVMALCLLPTVAIAALTNAERKSQFEKAMASIMAANSPTVFGYVRETLIKGYIACKPNKGQAVELLSASYFRSCEHEDAVESGPYPSPSSLASAPFTARAHPASFRSLVAVLIAGLKRCSRRQLSANFVGSG
jgi:hypothetical protein